MHTRAFFIAMGGGAIAATAAFLACSSSTTSSSGPDAGMDAAHDVYVVTDLGVTVFETSTFDGAIIIPDSGVPDVVTKHDAGVDAPMAQVTDGSAEAHAVDSGMLAACSVVDTTCDIVSQNCSSGSECAIVEEPNGSLGTICQPDQATEHLPKGGPCCPPADDTNPCDPGLECNGGNPCTDAGSPGTGLPPGWGGSRCTPRCCPADAGPNTANCGTAGDGGVQGHCDLDITFTNNGPTEYTVCTYPQTCEPFHVHPCIAGFGCEVENQAGTSECVVIYNPNGDAGATNGQACDFANQCADGLICIGNPGACEWMCHLDDAGTPFSESSLKPTPGYGGCPSGSTCTGIEMTPAWLGFCSPN